MSVTFICRIKFPFPLYWLFTKSSGASFSPFDKNTRCPLTVYSCTFHLLPIWPYVDTFEPNCLVFCLNLDLDADYFDDTDDELIVIKTSVPLPQIRVVSEKLQKIAMTDSAITRFIASGACGASWVSELYLREWKNHGYATLSTQTHTETSIFNNLYRNQTRLSPVKLKHHSIALLRMGVESRIQRA